MNIISAQELITELQSDNIYNLIGDLTQYYKSQCIKVKESTGYLKFSPVDVTNILEKHEIIARENNVFLSLNSLDVLDSFNIILHNYGYRLAYNRHDFQVFILLYTDRRDTEIIFRSMKQKRELAEQKLKN